MSLRSLKDYALGRAPRSYSNCAWFGEFSGGEILDNLDFVRANTRVIISLNEDRC